jgi:hypothetical protein
VSLERDVKLILTLRGFKVGKTNKALGYFFITVLFPNDPLA